MVKYNASLDLGTTFMFKLSCKILRRPNSMTIKFLSKISKLPWTKRQSYSCLAIGIVNIDISPWYSLHPALF